MGSWLVLSEIALLLLGQPGPPAAAGPAAVERRAEGHPASELTQPLDGPDPAAVARAVAELGAPQFSTRRRASQWLWEQGLAVERVLQQAADNPDREVRLRAGRILNDFRYGILPHVSEEINSLLRLFRDGEAPQRVTALQGLADREQFERVQHLIQLEPDPGVRRSLLVYLMENPRAVEHFLELERLDQLIAAVGADQEQAWRQTSLAQMLFSQMMVRQLAAKNKLDVLIRVIDREAAAEVRREMLSRLFQNPAAVASLVGEDQLELVLKLLGKEPELRVRSQWVMQMLGMSEAMRQLAANDRLERFLSFARRNVPEDQQESILQRALQHPVVVQAILDKRGVDGLVAAAEAEKDPATRGRLLAGVAASAAVRQVMDEAGQRALLLQLARQQSDAAARNEYMKTAVTSGWGYSLFRDAGSRKAVWEMVKEEQRGTEKNPLEWRGEAIYRLLTMSPGDDVLLDQTELKWLLEFLRDQALGEQRARIVQRLLSDYRTQRLLGGEQYFETLLELVQKLDGQQRGTLRGQLISLTTVRRLAAAGQVERVIGLAREESDAAARRAYLQQLFGDHASIAALLENGQYEPLWQLVLAEQDPLQHAMLRGSFQAAAAVIQRLQHQQQLDQVVQFARQADPPARRVYLLRLFRSSQALSLLVEAGHFDALFGLAQGDQDAGERATLLAAFYVNPQVVAQLVAREQVAQMLEFTEHLSGSDLRTYLQQICHQEPALTALTGHGHLEKLLVLVRQQKEEYYQSYLLRMILAAPAVVQRYAQQDQLKQLFAMVQTAANTARYQIWEGLLQRPENVTAVIEAGGLNDLLAQLRQEEDASRRGMLLGRAVAHQAVVGHLVARQRLDTILEVARQESEPQARQALLSGLFSSQVAVGALLEAGGFDALYELAAGENEDQPRAMLLARLLANAKTVEHLVATDRVGLLLDLASRQQDVQIRRFVLTQILTSQPAVAALIAKDQLQRVERLCRLEPEAAARRRLLAALLGSPQAVAWLADAGELEPTVREVLGEDDANARRSLLQGWVTRTATLSALLKHGLWEALFQAVELENDAAQRRQLMLPLLTAGVVLELPAVQERVELLIQLIGEEVRASGNSYVLSNLLSRAEVLQVIIASGRLEKLLELVGRPGDSVHISQLHQLLLNPATLEYLAEHNQLDRITQLLDARADDNLRRQLVQRLLSYEPSRRVLTHRPLVELLVALARAETENSHRQAYANSLLGNSRVRQHLIDHGQVAFLKEAAEWIPEGLRRQKLQQLLYSPTGLAAYHLERGEKLDAERLLAEQSSDDLGRLRLATYWLISGQIGPRIAELQEQLASAPDASSSRLLVYAQRAAGDLPAALAAAEAAGDNGLVLALQIELGHWPEAARLQLAGPIPLPIPWSENQLSTEPRQRAEQLSLLAGYQRLAGDPAVDQTLSALRELATAHAEDHDLRWWCTEALLLSGAVNEGLELLAEADPSRAFDLLVFRHEYDRALELLSWPGTSAELAWVEALPARGTGDQQTVGRVETALKVAHTLQRLGRRAEADRLLTLLSDYAAQQSDGFGNSSASPRRQCWERLCQGLLSMGQEQAAWEVGAKTALSPGSPPLVLSRLYSGRHSEAYPWWMFFRREYAGEPASATFARVHRMLVPPPEEDAAEFQRLVQAAAGDEDPFAGSPSASGALRLAAARACLQRGRLELAEQILGPAEDPDLQTAALLAELLWRQQRWAEAAAVHYRLWEDDRERLISLYLSGVALQRAGQGSEGQQRLQRVEQLALDSRARVTLARALLDNGLAQAAVEQARLVLRTAPPGHWDWHEAARLVGESLMKTDPAEAVHWLELSLLDDLRSYFYLLRDTDYLRTPAAIHRLRAAAAIGAGDAQTAMRFARLALAAAPGVTEISEELVAKLEQAGQDEAAAELFELQYGQYRQWVEAWSESALLHNNLAWLAARCDRQLDEALLHARRAVELEPNSGAYQDTLAEVYFRRGDRPAAVEHARRAVALDPLSTTLRQQLQRFEKAVE